MRIEKNMPPLVKTRNREKNFRPKIDKINSPDFKQQLASVSEKEIKERLGKLLNIIDEQGEKLKRSLDKNDLFEYKKRVKDFLRLIQNNFSQAKQSFSWDGRGNLKTYTIVEKVDDNLELLHSLFLEEQADALEILKKIDEIRGLLLDLYV